MSKKRIKSAIPIYGCAALWLMIGLIAPGVLLSLTGLLMMIPLSVLAYFVLSKLFPGREVEVRAAANSGDRDVDAMIEEAHSQLDSLHAANAAIPDEDISRKLDRMTQAAEGILKALERDTSQAATVRRFLNYYLPTAEKLMESYRMLCETSNPGENISHAKESVERSLGMIADAFEKQLDNLYKDRALDIETDIDVLETMMASDGLTISNGISSESLQQESSE